MFSHDSQASAGGAYVALLAASKQLPVLTSPASYSWSYDVTAAADTSLHVAQSDRRYSSGPHTLAVHASSSGLPACRVTDAALPAHLTHHPGNATVYCWLTNAAAPVIAVGQVFGSTLDPSASRLFRFVPDGTYSAYIVVSSVAAACSGVALSTQHAVPPSPSSFLAASSSVPPPPPPFPPPPIPTPSLTQVYLHLFNSPRNPVPHAHRPLSPPHTAQRRQTAPLTPVTQQFVSLRMTLPAFGPPHNVSTTHPIIGDT
jgi:hypothetical protein